MIKISGSSNDRIEVVIYKGGVEIIEEEYYSYNSDMLFKFDDGTKMRMTYSHGTWRAVVEKVGTALIMINPLLKYDEWYSDDFSIVTDVIESRWNERVR